MPRIVIEVRNGQFCEVYSDDPELEVVLVDWDTTAFEKGDHFVQEVEKGKLVLAVPNYPTNPIDKLPHPTRFALERAGVLQPTLSQTKNILHPEFA